MIRVPAPMEISLRCLIAFFSFSLVFALFSSVYNPDRPMRLGVAASSSGPRSRKVRRIAGRRDPMLRGSRGSFLPIRSVGGLLADPEALDGRAVTLQILPLQIVEQAATLAHDLEQAAAAVVILR